MEYNIAGVECDEEALYRNLPEACDVVCAYFRCLNPRFDLLLRGGMGFPKCLAEREHRRQCGAGHPVAAVEFAAKQALVLAACRDDYFFVLMVGSRVQGQ